jgi:hypothetical protein
LTCYALGSVSDSSGQKYKVELLDVSISVPNLPVSRADFANFSDPINIYRFRGLRCTSVQYLHKEIGTLIKEAKDAEARGVRDPKAPKRIERQAMYQKLTCLLGLVDAYRNSDEFESACQGKCTDSHSARRALVQNLVSRGMSTAYVAPLLRLSEEALQAFGKSGRVSSRSIERIIALDTAMRACDGRATISSQSVQAILKNPRMPITMSVAEDEVDEGKALPLQLQADLNVCIGMSVDVDV